MSRLLATFTADNLGDHRARVAEWAAASVQAHWTTLDDVYAIDLRSDGGLILRLHRWARGDSGMLRCARRDQRDDR